jgi:uncharacterized membrane protein YbhN (UPF0104 family)
MLRAQRAESIRARASHVATRFLPLGLAGLLFLSVSKQVPSAVAALRNVHPYSLWSLVSFLAWNQVATLAWRSLLRGAGVRAPALRELVRLKIEAQAVNQLVPTAGFAGEALRAIRAAAPSEVGAASLATLLDNIAGTVTGLSLSIGATLLYLQARSGQSELKELVLAATVAMFLVFVAAVVPFYFAASWLERLSPTNRLRSVIAPFAERRAELRLAFRDAIALRLVERIIAVSEIYIAFHAVGAPISLAAAALISSVFIIVSMVVFFVPGQLGAAEAAVTMIGTLLGIPPALGLSAALLRRARQLVVCAAGVTSLLLRKRHREPRHLRTSCEEAT